MNKIISKKTLIALAVLIVIAGLVGLVRPKTMPEKAAEVPEAPYQLTAYGKMTCLPHKDTSGPTTLECAYGLDASEGNYFALDLSAYQGPADQTSFDETIVVTGLYTPVEMLSSNQWENYNIRGVIIVSSISKLSETDFDL
jgi:hypothetical protein